MTGLLADPNQAARLQEAIDWLNHYAGSTPAKLRNAVQQAATAGSQLLVKGTISVLGGAFGFLLSTFFATFTMYYLFRDGEAAVDVAAEHAAAGSREERRARCAGPARLSARASTASSSSRSCRARSAA